MTRPSSRAGDLRRARLAAELAHRLDHVIHAPHVALREQAAVGVHRVAAAELDAAVGDEARRLAGPAEAERLELEQRHVA